MTSTPVTNLANPHAQPALVSKSGWLWITVLGLLMFILNWHFIRYTVLTGMSSSDWSHVLIIPFISLYYIWLHRDSLMATPRSITPIGAAFIYVGVAGYIIANLFLHNPMTQGYCMIVTLFGLTLMLLGPAMMRILWFPIAFMVFAVKISDVIWSIIATKMQAMAAHGAVLILELTSAISGMHATLRGSTIDLDYGQNGGPTPMNVAEACAGMRMLMAFLALGVALAFLFPRRWWQRATMIALSAPIAIFVNALRVSILGWLHLIDPELAHGDFHLFIGMLTLIPAAGLLMLVGWCLEKIIIVENPGRKKAPKPLPHCFDNNPLNPEIKQTASGLAIGLASFVLLAGIEVLALQYALPAIGLPTVLKGSLNLSGLLGQLVLHMTIALGAWQAARLALSRNSRRVPLLVGVALGMLTAGVVVQGAVIQYKGMYLSKLPVPLRHSFALNFPDEAGHWQLLHHEPKLPKDIEDELDTREYFNRFYFSTAAGLNKRSIGKQTIDTPLGERLSGWSGEVQPGELAKIHIAYYTGMLDAVPHVPDKCWLAAGQQLVERREQKLTLSRDDYRPDPDHPGMVLAESEGFNQTVRLPTDKIPVITFTGADADGRATTALYFFLANGQAVASNHQVRFSFNVQDRYNYYCKVEVMFPGVNDPDLVAEYAQDLLSDLMPEVMACLPDWTEVKAGTYPAPADPTPKTQSPGQQP